MWKSYIKVNNINIQFSLLKDLLQDIFRKPYDRIKFIFHLEVSKTYLRNYKLHYVNGTVFDIFFEDILIARKMLTMVRATTIPYLSWRLTAIWRTFWQKSELTNYILNLGNINMDFGKQKKYLANTQVISPALALMTSMCNFNVSTNGNF